MKKIVLLLVIAVGLVSLLEAKCNRTYVTNLLNQGFSVEQVVRICKTSNKTKTHYKKKKKSTSHSSKSHHAKHKKRKKHYAHSSGRLQWINLEDKQCSRYLANVLPKWNDTGCLVSYANARRVCSAVGGRLPSLNDFKRVAAKCGQNLRRVTDDIGDAANRCYHRNGVDTYMGHKFWTRTAQRYVPSNKFVANLSQNVIEGSNEYSHNHVICVK